MEALQLSFFGDQPVAVDETFRAANRLALTQSAWIEHVPGWLCGDRTLFRELLDLANWRFESRQMYEREVDVPRGVARVPRDCRAHPIFWRAASLLSLRYGYPLPSVSLAYYRNGADSVAPHGDRMPDKADSLVAIVSLGAPRRFILRPTDGGDSMFFSLGDGDLLAMGGSCQQEFVHGVPKCRHADPRISVQFRSRDTDDV